MPQRHQLAQIAVALHIRRQQRHRHALETVIPSGGPQSSRGPQSRNLSSVLWPFHINHHPNNRLHSRFLRCLVKLHRRIQTIRIRQRHGRHFLFNRCRDDLFRRRHSPQERIVAVTMQMYEHGCPGPEREEGGARLSAGMVVHSNRGRESGKTRATHRDKHGVESTRPFGLVA